MLSMIPNVYFRNRLLIVGGGNSAVEAAIRCYHVGAQVSISYRGAAFSAQHIKYWLYPEANGLTSSGKIGGLFNTVPVKIDGSCVTLRDVNTGQLKTVETDFVLVLIGFEADMTLPKLAGVALSPDLHTPDFNEMTMQTNVTGCYIAGTAVAGTQDQFRVFIENCHVHTDRILCRTHGAAGKGQQANRVSKARELISTDQGDGATKRNSLPPNARCLLLEKQTDVASRQGRPRPQF